MPAERLYLLLSVFLISCGNGVVKAAEGGAPPATGLPSLDGDNAVATVTGASVTRQAAHQVQTPTVPTAGSSLQRLADSLCSFPFVMVRNCGLFTKREGGSAKKGCSWSHLRV